MNFCRCSGINGKDVRLVDGVAIHLACSQLIVCTVCDGQAIAVSVVGQRRECRDCSPLFADQFFDERFDLERELLDGFIYNVGGVHVQDLLADSGQIPVNADYFFDEQNIVVELKSLQTEFALQPGFQKKNVERLQSYIDDGIITPEELADPAKWPPEFWVFSNSLLRDTLQK